MTAIERAKAWLAWSRDESGECPDGTPWDAMGPLLFLCERLLEHARHDEGCSASFNVDIGGITKFRCKCGFDEVEKMLRVDPGVPREFTGLDVLKGKGWDR